MQCFRILPLLGILLFATTSSARDNTLKIEAIPLAQTERKLDSKARDKDVPPTLIVNRDAVYAGGKPGFVKSAIAVHHAVRAKVTNYEWGITSHLINQAGAGQNVAIYGRAEKHSTGPTWAFVAEADDVTGKDEGPLVLSEFNIGVNGENPNKNRIMQDIIVKKYDPKGEKAWAHAGVRIRAEKNDKTRAAYVYGLQIQDEALTGIDLSADGNTGIELSGAVMDGIRLSGDYTGAAITLNSGAPIAFDAERNVMLSHRANEDALELKGADFVPVDRFLRLGKQAGQVELSGGRITVTQTLQVITSGGKERALATIEGGKEGGLLILSGDGNLSVDLEDGKGNLSLNGDFTLNHADDRITLVRSGPKWVELSRSDNG